MKPLNVSALNAASNIEWSCTIKNAPKTEFTALVRERLSPPHITPFEFRLTTNMAGSVVS